jgi:hypothetical protein
MPQTASPTMTASIKTAAVQSQKWASWSPYGASWLTGVRNTRPRVTKPSLR